MLRILCLGKKAPATKSKGRPVGPKPVFGSGRRYLPLPAILPVLTKDERPKRNIFLLSAI